MFIANSAPQNQTFGVRTQISPMVGLNKQNSKAAEAGREIMEKLAPGSKNIQVKIQQVLPNDVLECRLYPEDTLLGKISPNAKNVSPDERRLVDYGTNVKILVSDLLDEQKRANLEKKFSGFGILINKLTGQDTKK